MKIRDPWTDPRIEAIRSEDAFAYLTCHGWTNLGSAINPRLQRYERSGDAAAPKLLVPTAIDDGPSLQRLIDLIGEIAKTEGRFAGDVISDILHPHGTGSSGLRGDRTANGDSMRNKTSEPIGKIE